MSKNLKQNKLGNTHGFKWLFLETILWKLDNNSMQKEKAAKVGNCSQRPENTRALPTSM